MGSVIPLWTSWSSSCGCFLSLWCFYVLIHISILPFSSLSHFDPCWTLVNIFNCPWWSRIYLLMFHRSNILPYHHNHSFSCRFVYRILSLTCPYLRCDFIPMSFSSQCILSLSLLNRLLVSLSLNCIGTIAVISVTSCKCLIIQCNTSRTVNLYKNVMQIWVSNIIRISLLLTLFNRSSVYIV